MREMPTDGLDREKLHGHSGSRALGSGVGYWGEELPRGHGAGSLGKDPRGPITVETYPRDANSGTTGESWLSYSDPGAEFHPFIHSFTQSVSIWGAALELQHFGHLTRKTDSLENTPMLGKSEGKTSGRQRMRWLASLTQRT